MVLDVKMVLVRQELRRAGVYQESQSLILGEVSLRADKHAKGLVMFWLGGRSGVAVLVENVAEEEVGWRVLHNWRLVRSSDVTLEVAHGLQQS